MPRSTLPLCLTVPGLNNSGAGHWQTLWEETRADCVRVDLGYWSVPIRNMWVSRIEAAVLATDRPIIFVAHSLGCHAVAWWAKLAADDAVRARIAGALLVAPPEVDIRFVGKPMKTFAPSPVAPFWFPTVLVASTDDPYAHPRRSARLADRWRSRFVDLGACGHVNVESGLGEWAAGQVLLDDLIDGCSDPRAGDAPAHWATR